MVRGYQSGPSVTAPQRIAVRGHSLRQPQQRRTSLSVSDVLSGMVSKSGE